MDFATDVEKNMKNRKENGGDYECNSSDEISTDSDYAENIKTNLKRSLLKTKKGLPRRRPDPNVFNRNALMARENRRKKKEYVAMLEQEIESNNKTNRKLQKQLKEQAQYIEILKNERNYFKSILANKSEIMSLVKLVRSTKIPQMEWRRDNFQNESSTLSSKDNSLQQLQQLESLITNDNDIINNLEPYSSSILDNPEFSVTDFHKFPLSDNSWDKLLQGSNDMNDMNDLNDINYINYFNESDQRKQQQQTINDDHSYHNFVPNQNESNDSGSGVCLHVSSGKLSLEFCASCHANSKMSVGDF